MTQDSKQREPTEQEILDILAEECAEVIHIISKIRRFGIDDWHPYREGLANRSILKEELIDVLAMVQWAEEREIINLPENHLHTGFKFKRDKVRKYLR